MKKSILTVVFLVYLVSCKQTIQKDNYEVKDKNLANFSFSCHMLYPKERLQIKLNDKIIYETIGKDNNGTYLLWKFFKYPQKITKIQAISYYNGKIVLNKTFQDTLTNIKQISLFIYGPGLREISKNKLFTARYIPIDSSYRKIVLVNDSIYYKGSWRDEVR